MQNSLFHKHLHCVGQALHAAGAEEAGLEETCLPPPLPSGPPETAQERPKDNRTPDPLQGLSSSEAPVRLYQVPSRRPVVPVPAVQREPPPLSSCPNLLLAQTQPHSVAGRPSARHHGRPLCVHVPPTGLSSLRDRVALGEALLRCVHADPSSPRRQSLPAGALLILGFRDKLGPASPPHTGLQFCRSLRSNPSPLCCQVVLKRWSHCPSAPSEPRG